MPIIVSYSLKFVIILVAYFITAKMGLSLDAVSGFATLVWVPTGISLAALVLFGSKLWPAIFLAAALVNLTTGAPILVALGIATGNTLEAVVAAFLLTKFTKILEFPSFSKDVFNFVVLAGFLSTAISATIGTTSLYLGGLSQPENLINTWTAWWIGDMLGNFIFFPLIIAWKNPFSRIDKKVNLELMAFLVIIIITNLSIFFKVLEDNRFLPPLRLYFIFPVLFWAALRFEKRTVTTAIAFTSLVAILSTIAGVSPFVTSGGTLSANLLNMQTFIGITSVMILTLYAVVFEREAVQRGLENRVRERTQDLEEEKTRALRGEAKEKELEIQERDFVSVASHQLLTPLALVSGYISMLVSGKLGSVDKEAKKYLEESFHGTERMSGLVKSLLTTSRIESGYIKIEKLKFDLSKLMHDVASDLNSKLESKGLDLKLSARTPILVKADQKQTREVLTNILDNAIKYTEKGSISVTISSKRKLGQVIVSDSGIGISKEALPHIFEKFFMSKNWVIKQSESHGLGLYISKLLLGMMGGTIRVESSVGIGSTFTITLPLA